MAFDPSNSAIRVDASLEEQLKGAYHEQIKELLKMAAVDQHLAVREWDQSILTPTALADAPRPQKFARSVTINGTKTILESSSQEELDQAETAIYRVAMAQPVATETHIERPRNDRGQFDSDLDAANKAELELQFKRGEISASDYLQKSGAVADYLAQQGVPLADLKASVAEKSEIRAAQGWADATEEFKARHPEWLGGEANAKTIGQILIENDLVDASDKLEAMESAYNHARENNMLVTNPQVEARDRIASATSINDILDATGYNDRVSGRSSGMFGR
jgi:hypothetical protein